MIKILFFGQLREVLQTEILQLDINKLGKLPVNVAELRVFLQAKSELWQEYLCSSRSLVAVNQTMASETNLIADDDEVALFPPVTGG